MSPPRKSKTPAIVHQPVAQFYERFVADIKQRIRTAQIKAAESPIVETASPQLIHRLSFTHHS